MAWTNETINVGTSATKIVPSANVNADRVTFRTDGTNETRLGGPGVTAADGVQLQTGTVYTFDISSGAIYLVAATVAHNVNFAFHNDDED